MLVMDASVVVKWFVDEEHHAEALQLTRDEALLIAPDILLAEVAHVLRRKIRMNILSDAQAVNAIATVKRTFVHLVPSMALIDTAFSLSSEMDHSIYDALYLACALQDTADVLVTADRKFAAKAEAVGFGSKIRILGAVSSGFSPRQENDHG